MIAALISLSTALSAIPQPSAAEQAFQQKDYTAYLTAAIPDFASKHATAPSFDRLMMLTIALDKTNGWEADSAKQLQDLLKATPHALRTIENLHKLLTGDMTGLQDLYRARPMEPDYSAASKSIKLLREHGYPIAANALNTLCATGFKESILAWLSLPADARKTVDALMETRYPPNTPNRKQFLQTAISLYKNPPKDTGLDPEAYLAFFLWFGTGSYEMSYDTAAEFLGAKQRAGAYRVARALVEPGETAYAAHRALAGFFFFRAGDYPATAEAYQAGLTAIREPYVRDIRLDYDEFLVTMARLKPKDYTPPILADVQQDPDPLVAGDALLVGAQYPAASAKYQAVLHDANAPFIRRLSAWAGLLDSAPAAALQQAPAVLAAIEKHSPAERAEELRWLGRQLARAVGREIPRKPGAIPYATRMQYRPLREAAGWETALVTLVDRMLAMDANVLLQPDKLAPQQTFRYTASLIYGLAGHDDRAKAIITREITYTLPAPPGGWPTFGGPKTPDTDTPRQFTSPARGEAERVMQEVMDALARYRARKAEQQGEEALPVATAPMNTPLIIELAAKIIPLQDQHEVKAQMRRMGEQVALAVTALDPMPKVTSMNQPPPPIRAVDMAQFAPIAKAITDVLADPEAAREAPQLVFLGLEKGMKIASNPKLLEELYTLAVHGLERYVAVTGNTEVGIDLAHSFAAALETRLVVDVKPYATRMRAHFPKPERKR